MKPWLVGALVYLMMVAGGCSGDGAVPGRDAAATDAAIARLRATGRLRPASDPGRVLPTLHDYQARPEVTIIPTHCPESYALAQRGWL